MARGQRETLLSFALAEVVRGSALGVGHPSIAGWLHPRRQRIARILWGYRIVRPWSPARLVLRSWELEQPIVVEKFLIFIVTPALALRRALGETLHALLTKRFSRCYNGIGMPYQEGLGIFKMHQWLEGTTMFWALPSSSGDASPSDQKSLVHSSCATQKNLIASENDSQAPHRPPGDTRVQVAEPTK